MKVSSQQKAKMQKKTELNLLIVHTEQHLLNRGQPSANRTFQARKKWS